MLEIHTVPGPRELLDSIEQRGEEIERLAAHLAELEQDVVYRYCQQSVKVFELRHAVRACRELLASLAPDGARLDPWFVAICREACAHCSRAQVGSRNVLADARPLLEGFWHCSYFVRMLARVGRGVNAAPRSDRAAVLALYGLR